MNNKIDFVLPWVDGNDLAWQKSFKEYLPESKKSDDTNTIRYRDWDNLRYWFRGVEKFAPWVNKIHFITNGQLPEWLNLNAPKLNFVKHTDYIPHKYLPTFSANPIEINLHRIKELSEQFVYFNDDLFIIDEIEPTRFFRNGIPCDMAILNNISPCGIAHIILNDLEIINSEFSKPNTLKQNFFKWFNHKYGMRLFRTCALLPWPMFTGFFDPHLTNSYLKSTFDEVWSKYDYILENTSANRFRSLSDVNQYLFRYWQLVKGRFYPLDVTKDSMYYEISDNNIDEIENCIIAQKKKLIVLNDDINISSFEFLKEKINNAFNKILPEKSSFEI